MTTFWHPDVAKWVALRIPGCERGFGNCRAMGVLNSHNKVIAGLVFHDWNPECGTIEISAAAENPRWFTRGVINEAMNYAFKGAGVQAIFGRTQEDNKRTRKIWRALGSTETVIPRLFGRDQDGIVMVVTDDAWNASKYCEADHG